jgi:hypothetical protein
MRRSIKAIVILAVIFFGLSCSSYSIKNDIEDSSILSKVKNAGIIFRISNGSRLTDKELIRNLSYWLSVYQKKGNVTVIKDASDALTVFNNPQQRFYQLSNEEKYLKYKTLGVVNLFLQNNQNELLNIISRNSLDSIIVLEVYSVISTQMQFFDYESVLVVADANLNIGYLDHQSDYFESASSSIDELKNQTLDKINGRLIDNLSDLNLLGKKTEGEKKVLSKDIGKSKPPAEEKPVEKKVEKSQEKISEKPAGKTEVKPLEKPAEIKTDKPVEKPEEKPAVKPVENAGEKSIEKTADKPADIQIEKPKEPAPSAEKTPAK